MSIEQNIFCSMLTSAHPFFMLNKIYIYYKNKDAQICSFAHLAHPFLLCIKKTPFKMSKVSKFGHPYHCEFYLFYIWKKISEQGEHWAKYFLLNAHVCSPFFYVNKIYIYITRIRMPKFAHLLTLLILFLLCIKKKPFQLSKVSKFGHPYHCDFYLFYIWKKTKWAR